MNPEFFRHLTLAVRHAVQAVGTLVPPGPRRHLEAIGRELAALLAELAAMRAGDREQGSGSSPVSGGPRQSRRIHIEE